MGVNNSLNFPNLTTKTTPVTGDIGLIADSAASNVIKQATLGTFPGIPAGSFLAGGALIAAMPGALSITNSNTQTQSLASTLNSRVYLQPFCVNAAMTVGTVGCYVITGVAASTMTVGIYASNGSLSAPQPTGNALGAVSIATTANNTYANGAVSIALSPKTIYWAAIQTSTATTLSLQCTQMNVCCNIANAAVSGTGYQPLNITYTNSYSAGTLPNINPVSLNTVVNTYTPVMIFG